MVWCTPFDESHFDARCAENSRFVMRKIQEVRPDILLVFVNYNHWVGGTAHAFPLTWRQS
jgi:hypothetical protein